MSSESKARKKSEAGVTIIETAMAAFILVVGSLAMIGLIIGSIATNNRNRMDSTQTMLSTSIVEQIDSTIIGSGESVLVDCAGNSHTIATAKGGANLSGANIDFSENIAADPTKNKYHMDYVVRTPCASTGTLQGTYDVRWNVSLVGDGVSATNTYMLTIGGRLKNHGEGNRFFALPVTMRVMSGN